MKFSLTTLLIASFTHYFYAQSCAIWECADSTPQDTCASFISSSPQNEVRLTQCVTNKECNRIDVDTFIQGLSTYEYDNSTITPGSAACQFANILGSYCEQSQDCLSQNCVNSVCSQGAKVSGASCSDSSECASSICQNSLCMATLPLYSLCNNSIDFCSTGLVCRKFAYCSAKSALGEQCSDDADCESNYCSGSCRALIDYTCSLKSDCPSQSRALSPAWFQYCDDNNICQVSKTATSCTADKECITLHCEALICSFLEGMIPCSANSDCLQTDYYCGDGYCRLRLDSGSCVGDAMCQAKTRLCIDGNCISGTTSPTRACTSTSDCPSPYFYCSGSSICTAKRSSGLSCSQDQECQSNYCRQQGFSQTCTLNMSDKACIPDSNNLSGLNNECLNLDKDYYFCNPSTSLCIGKGEDSSFSCSHDPQCMYNECTNKTCKPTTEKPCFTDSNCPAGYYCNQNVATRRCMSVLTKACSDTTSDCAPYGVEYECNIQSGLCEQNSTIGSSCESDSDCTDSTAFFCDLNQQCQPISGVNYPCSSDTDCRSTLRCFNTACQSAIPSGSNCDNSEECASRSLYCKDTDGDLSRDTCELKEIAGQSCLVFSDCSAGHLCYNSICVAFLSVTVGTELNSSVTDTPDQLSSLCTHGLLVEAVCSSLAVLTSAQTASFPYLCTVGQVCEYRRTTGIQDTYESHMCQCAGVDNVKGFCRIVLGMPQYTTLLASILAILQHSSECSNQLQYSLDVDSLLHSAEFKSCSDAPLSLFNTAHSRYFQVINNPQIQNCQISSCLSRLPLHPSTYDSQASYTPSCSVSIPVGLYQNEPLTTVAQVLALRQDILTGDTVTPPTLQTANKTVALQRFFLSIDSTTSNQVYSEIITTLYDIFVFDSYNAGVLCSEYKEVLKLLTANIARERLTDVQVISKAIGSVNIFLQSRDETNSNCITNFEAISTITSFFFGAASQIDSFSYAGTQIHAFRNTLIGTDFSHSLSSGAQIILPSGSISEVLQDNNLSSLKSNIYEIKVAALVGRPQQFRDTVTSEAIVVDLWSDSYTPLSVSNLNEPVELQFQLNRIDASGNIACAFWNVDYWDTSGLQTSTLVPSGGLTTVVCKSSHLSIFAIINLPSSSALHDYIRAAIFVSILLATFLVLFFVTVKVHVKHQSLTSRFSEVRDNLFFESGNIDIEGTFDDLRNEDNSTHHFVGEKLEIKMAVLEHYPHLKKRYSCCQLFVNLLFYRMPLISLLQYDHVLTTFLKLLIIYTNLLLTSLVLCIIARQLPELTSETTYYVIALMIGFLYVPNSFYYMCKTASVGGQGMLISLGKALLFELARVAQKAIKVNNRSPQRDHYNSSTNRADLSSLGDVTLNFFGRDESAKTIKLVFQDYKIRTYSKIRSIALHLSLGLFCILSLIIIILQYPQSEEGRSRFVTAVMISLLSGIFMWSVLKIALGSLVLHGCRRKQRGGCCVSICVDAVSLVVFNDMPVG